MNFYKHHIGDYAQATAHLSFVEDAAYSRLLRKYYAEEKPLPADIKSIQRLVGARTRDEKEAVANVLDEFFILELDGWHNKRCDDELLKWRQQAETNRRIAEEREAKKRVAKPSNEKSTNRAQGGNEPFNESLQKREPNQNPESRIQNPRSSKPDRANDDDGTSNSAGVEICDWVPGERISRDLEFLHGVPPMFVEIQLVEFRAFWRDQGKSLTPGEWDSKFIQRVVEQWDRKNRLQVAS